MPPRRAGSIPASGTMVDVKGVKMVGEKYRTKGYNPTGFTVNEFVDYMINRGRTVPHQVNEDRWRAMLKWFETR
ncbi:MAG: hypothetical protein DWQ19_11275 [Crenarchaeota archaeon]|mgnify:CR=1 FL=1|nr:MAG: hypothetical protein DWQ19_11275 [Thermoproteota archaeon]